MKRFFVAFAMIMASMITMAQSQFYVILKDGTGASFPEAVVDSLTFEDSNGAKIYGFEDLANSIAKLRKEVDSLKKVVAGITPSTGTDDTEHDYVDLGLPSGTLWATTNVGADTPSDYGFYICWGETDKKLTYDRTGGKWHGVDDATLRSQGVIDEYMNLTAKYDAATLLWGDDWRMPTVDEIRELIRYCKIQWTQMNNIAGILCSSTTNANSIFIPCSGAIINSEENYVGTRAYYQSSTSIAGTSADLFITQDNVSQATFSRSHGRTIRAVRRTENYKPYFDTKDSILNGHQFVDLGLSSGTLWATSNIGASSDKEVGENFMWGYPTTQNDLMIEEGFEGMTKENLLKYGHIDNDGNIVSTRDAATYNWGAQWRMPTTEECEELLKECTIKSVIGKDDTEASYFKLTGPNGNTIIIPVNGYGFDLWSSTVFDDNSQSYTLHKFDTFDEPLVSKDDWEGNTKKRGNKLPIRPVVNLK